MGRDSIDPFSQDPQKGCFVLCKTSNPSSSQVQGLVCSGRSARCVYEEIAHLAQTWNENDNIGLVVGATDVEVRGLL